MASGNADAVVLKNWFSAKNAPDGAHLVALARHSDAVLETFLLLAGRKDLVAAKVFADTRQKVQRMLKLLADIHLEKGKGATTSNDAR